MPFQSKAQMRKIAALERQGKLPKGTTRKWARKTKCTKCLPERKKKY